MSWLISFNPRNESNPEGVKICHTDVCVKSTNNLCTFEVKVLWEFSTLFGYKHTLPQGLYTSYSSAWTSSPPDSLVRSSSTINLTSLSLMTSSRFSGPLCCVFFLHQPPLNTLFIYLSTVHRDCSGINRIGSTFLEKPL